MVVVVLLVVILVLLVVVVLSNKSNFEGYSPKLLEYYSKNVKNRFIPINLNNQLKGIDCIYVVCMPSRREYISGVLNRLGYSYVLFDAITTNDLSDEDYSIFSNILDSNSIIYGKKSRLAVHMSFVMCMINAQKENYSTVILFEDDLLLNVTNEILEKSVIEFINSPFDIFYMGYCFLDCNKVSNNWDYKYLLELKRDAFILCFHSMIYKRKGFNTFINVTFPLDTPSDNKLNEYYLSKQNKLKICIPRSPYFYQNYDSGSLNQAVIDRRTKNVTCKF